jgi:hypothetical protein
MGPWPGQPPLPCTHLLQHSRQSDPATQCSHQSCPAPPCVLHQPLQQQPFSHSQHKLCGAQLCRHGEVLNLRLQVRQGCSGRQIQAQAARNRRSQSAHTLLASTLQDMSLLPSVATVLGQAERGRGQIRAMCRHCILVPGPTCAGTPPSAKPCRHLLVLR